VGNLVNYRGHWVWGTVAMLRRTANASATCTGSSGPRNLCDVCLAKHARSAFMLPDVSIGEPVDSAKSVNKLVSLAQRGSHVKHNITVFYTCMHASHALP